MIKFNFDAVFGWFAFSLAVVFAAPTAFAQNVVQRHADVLSRYMAKDVVAIAYVDLNDLNVDDAIDAAVEIGFDKEEVLAELVEVAPMIKSEMEQLKRAGITSAFAFLRMSDASHGSTSWVFPVESGKDSNLAADVVRGRLDSLANQFQQIEAANGAVLAAGNAAQLNGLKSDPSVINKPFKEFARALGSGSAGLVIFANDDFRRALRELFPELPEPFTALTGKLLANCTKWAGISVTLNRDLNVSVVLESTDEQSAQAYVNIAQNALEYLKTLPEVVPFLENDEQEFMFKAVLPVRTGNRVSVNTDQLTSDKTRLARILKPATEMAQKKAAVASRMNKLRQITLAMLNFESAHQRMPTQASVDPNGKLLLSWRVQILPFMDQKERELYAKFKHDEPWDSVHNLKLAEQMPKIYADASRTNNRAGRTVFQVPTGKGRLLTGGRHAKFGDIKDGSSNTIFVANVAPEHAVVWTKPSDWEVDLNDPVAQLHAPGREVVEVAFWDGSVHRFSLKAPAELWRRAIQHDDGEVFRLGDIAK